MEELLDEPDGFARDFNERIRVTQSASPAPRLAFKSAAAFAAEYVPLSYVVEGIVRTSSLYTLTARTGHGKTGFLVAAALAVASGRDDILAREIHQGRVAYLACENPDDIRMRLKIAAWLLNIDLDALGDDLVILDMRAKPEAVHAELKRLAGQEPFALVIVDTLAAFFDGDDINNAVQGGQFMRRLRPLTQIAGPPAVIVAAHPVKNASEEALVPYGSGAILNEIDGNLTLWKRAESGVVSLHWQGKLRGLEFDPLPFRFEVTGSPDILDAKGREVHLPTLRPASAENAEARQEAEVDISRKLLLAVIAKPGATIRAYSESTGLSKSSVDRRLASLAKQGLVEKILDQWTATAKGRKAA